jgi:hypothetical protein
MRPSQNIIRANKLRTRSVNLAALLEKIKIDVALYL